MDIYGFEVKDMSGNTISMSEFKGKVLLIVNTATECGFTPEYDALEKLYEELKGQNFELLDFPCNQFGNQAPGTEEEIHEFCKLRFGVKFRQFQKIDVNGPNAIPLYEFLKKEKGFAGFDESHPIAPKLHEILSEKDPNYQASSEIKWNFTKFLIDQQGHVVERYEPSVSIEKIREKIKTLV